MNSLDVFTCHVCGAVRPDDRISVLSTVHHILNVPVVVNVRYCNDRLACIEGAKDVNFIKGAEGKDG